MRLFLFMVFIASAAISAPQSKPKKAIDIEGIKIEAEFEKPEVFFILQRDESGFLNTLTLDPRESAEKTIERLAQSELFNVKEN